MKLSELPEEILLQIIGGIKIPLPPLRTPCIRKDYHQHDLVSLMQVSKYFNTLIASVLYDHPVVDNPALFLYGVEDPVKKNRISLNKQQMLTHVKILELLHRNSLYELANTNQYTAYRQWEQEFTQQSQPDIVSSTNATKLLRRLRTLNIEILPNIKIVRIGAFDANYWSRKVAQGNEIRRRDSIQDYGEPWYNRYQVQHAESYDFTRELIISVQPEEYVSYIAHGPLAWSSKTHERYKRFQPTENIRFEPPPRPQTYTHHMTIHKSNDKNISSPYPVVIEGVLNRWILSYSQEHIFISPDTLMKRITELIDSIDTFIVKPWADQTTTLMIFGAEELLYSVAVRDQQELLEKLQKKLYSVYLEPDDDPLGLFDFGGDDGGDEVLVEFPPRAVPTEKETKRYGIKGLVECNDLDDDNDKDTSQLKFVDVDDGVLGNFKIRFKDLSQISG